MPSLRRQLLVPNVLFAVLAAAALGWVAYASAVEARALEVQIARVRSANALIFRLNQISAETQRSVLSYRFRAEEGFLANVAQAEAETQHVIFEIGRLEIPPRGRALWSEFVTSRAVQVRARAELLAATRRGRPPDLAVSFEKWELATAKATALLADVSVYNLQRLDRAVAGLVARRARTLVVFLALVVATALAITALSIYLDRSLVLPLVDMTRGAERIATERLALPDALMRREDEIGVLARTFERTTEELVRTNERLGESVRARDDFLSVASHELKTPLTSLKLQLQLALRGAVAEDAPETVRLGTALRQVTRLERLVSDLLDVTRIRSGHLELRVDQANLSDIVGSVLDRFSADLATTPVERRIQGGVVGRWDAERLDQVVTNLVANAVKHAPGAPLEVSLVADAHRARLLVRDAGPGIRREAQERIFERFERAPGARVIGGLGLGLYIAKQIVEAHGGTIAVDSEPGRGAAFRVDLPLARSDEAAPAA